MALSTNMPILKKIDPQILSLIGGIAGTVSLRVFAAGAGFLSSILLARYLGVYNLGILAYASAWAGILLVLSTLGFNQLLVREIAIHASREEWGQLAGLLRFTTRAGIFASVCLAILGALAAFWLSRNLADRNLLWTFLIIVATLPMGILVQFRQSAMRGLKHVNKGLFPDMAVRPVLSIIFVTVGYFYFGQQLSPPQAASISLIAGVIAFMLGNHLLRRAIPEPVKVAEPVPHDRRWLKMAFPLFLITAIQFVNLQADVLMLGYLAPIEEVGFYTVGKSLVEAIIFVLIAAEMTAAPRIAQMYSGGEVAALQKTLRKSAQLAAASSIPIALLFLLRGEWVLSLYGKEFIPGLLALQVLCVGQLINALCGPIGQLAIHTGHDKATTYVVAIAAVVNILFNWLLIPHYGAVGAAAATTMSLAVWNIGLLVYIMFKTGLSPLAFPLPRGFF